MVQIHPLPLDNSVKYNTINTIMKNALAETQKNFESSSSKTPEYLSWHRLFKREFTKFLGECGATKIQIGKPNHFDMSGFFTVNGRMWYFRIEDVRWSKGSMLVRIVQSYLDYHGGHNFDVSMNMGEITFKREIRDVFAMYSEWKISLDISVKYRTIDDVMSMFIGKQIEITHVNSKVKSIGIMVHLHCKPNELAMPEAQLHVAQLVKTGCKYLHDEGFIPDNPTGWITHVCGVVHDNSNNQTHE